MRDKRSRRSSRNLAAERWISIAALCFAAIAGIAAVFCHGSAIGRSWTRNVLHVASFVPTRKWAMYASYPDEAAIYYFFAWPILPLAIAWMLTRFGFPLKATFMNGQGILGALRTIIAIPVLASVGALQLMGKNGSDLPFLHIGTHLEQLVLFGWVGFAVPGILFGTCGLYCCGAFLQIKGMSRK